MQVRWNLDLSLWPDGLYQVSPIHSRVPLFRKSLLGGLALWVMALSTLYASFSKAIQRRVQRFVLNVYNENICQTLAFDEFWNGP